MLRLMLVLSVVAAAFSMMAGCSSSGGSAGASSLTSIKDLAGEWTLSKLEGTDIASLLPASMKKPTLGIGADGKVSGFTGVNRLTSSIDMDALMKGQFKLAPAATTRMAGPAEAMNVESKFLNGLMQAKSAKVSGGTLSLSDGAKELLSFVKGK
ncbi:MAG: META domain-containing protein [Phycisphaerales bacterium]|nr:META domain-containing protein [Phycisphaerales bacterium]